MADSQPPAGPSRVPGPVRLPGAEPADGDASTESKADPRLGVLDRLGGPWLRTLGVGATAVLGLLLFLGFASLLGDDLRRAVLVDVDVSPDGSEPSFSDAPGEAARFFSGRDSVLVRIPWDMTVADFLGLYHLETNPSARDALRAQLGAADDADLLREGDRVALTLTATRPNL